MTDFGAALFDGADEGIFEVAEVLAARIREVGGEIHEGYTSANAVRIDKGHSRVNIEEWVPESRSKVEKYKCPERRFIIAIVSKPVKGEGKVKEQVDFLISSGTAKNIIVRNCVNSLQRVVERGID